MSCQAHNPTANATLSGDPTNTLGIRQSFIDEAARRMRRVRGLVRTTVGYETDALQLKQDAPDSLTINAEPKERFEFTTDAQRVNAFARWLRGAIVDEVLAPVPITEVENGAHWTGTFVRDAYVTGYQQATGRLMQRGVSTEARDTDSILNLPVPATQLQQLYTRTFENLRTISREAAEPVRETLTRGLAEGWNPEKMATALNQELQSVNRSRLRTLARTEVINSHSEATLDRYESAGVDVVSHSEWATADDDRVCPICRPLEGREFTVDEMRDGSFELPGVSFEIQLRPPAHPNCRCTIMPVIGAEPPSTPLEDRLPDRPAPEANTTHQVTA